MYVCMHVCMRIFGAVSNINENFIAQYSATFLLRFCLFFVLVFALRCGMWLCALWLEVNVVTKGKRCPNNSLKTVSCYVCIFG